MADNVQTLNDILLAQAVEQMNKSHNRVKSSTLIAVIVEFVNSDKSHSDVISVKFPKINVSRVRQIVKTNKMLNGKVWPVVHDDKVMLVNVTKASQPSA